MIEGEPVEFLLDSTSGAEVCVGLEKHGLDKLVGQLDESGQLNVDFDQC